MRRDPPTHVACVISPRVLREGLFTSSPLPTNSRGFEILNSLPSCCPKSQLLPRTAGPTSLNAYGFSNGLRELPPVLRVQSRRGWNPRRSLRQCVRARIQPNRACVRKLRSHTLPPGPSHAFKYALALLPPRRSNRVAAVRRPISVYWAKGRRLGLLLSLARERYVRRLCAVGGQGSPAAGVKGRGDLAALLSRVPWPCRSGCSHPEHVWLVGSLPVSCPCLEHPSLDVCKSRRACDAQLQRDPLLTLHSHSHSTSTSTTRSPAQPPSTQPPDPNPPPRRPGPPSSSSPSPSATPRSDA